jgi:hypothetical protein
VKTRAPPSIYESVNGRNRNYGAVAKEADDADGAAVSLTRSRAE